MITDNFQILPLGFYIVRTQAGFRKALKHYSGESCCSHHGFITTYPSLIRFRTEHGYLTVLDMNIHVNKAIEDISNILEILKQN